MQRLLSNNDNNNIDHDTITYLIEKIEHKVMLTRKLMKVKIN